MQIVETKVYNFDELNDNAKETARAWAREGYFDIDWYDCIYDDAKTIGKFLGIDINKIYFSGFWSQGDGATFEGSFDYNPDIDVCELKVIEYAPLDKTIQAIAQDWQALQRKYKLTGKITHNGRYYHSKCNLVSCYNEVDDYEFSTSDSLVSNNNEPGAEATRILRRFMDWTYNQLETAYNDLNSDENIDEHIRINEYTFTELGKRFG